MSSLPDGWEYCQMGDVFDIVGGGTPPSKDPTNFTSEGGIPWITPADLSGYRYMYIQRGSRNLTEKGYRSSSAKLLPAGSVLFSSRAPIGYVAIATNEAATNQGFKSFVIPEGFDSRYVYYWLRHIKPEAEARATGTTFKELSGSSAAKLPFLIAPFAEQKRIADKLDVLLARVDACRARLDRVPAILKRFRQAVLAAAVSGRLTEEWREKNSPGESGADLRLYSRRQHREFDSKRRLEQLAEDEILADIPDTWCWCSTAELVDPGAEIVYGIVQPGPKLGEGVPYVRGMDIEDGTILVDQLMKTSPEIACRYARSSLKGGDVLLGIIRATKVAIVPEQLAGGNITQGTARFRPSSVIRSRYLAIVLEAPNTQAWLHNHYRGIDMPGLNLADVRQVPVPLPPLAEQEEIVRLVGTLLDRLSIIESRYAGAHERVNQITACLLAKAFRGDLIKPTLLT